MIVNVLGTEYQINSLPYVSKEQLTFGSTNYMKQTINIDEGLGSDAYKSTLIHELIHTILFAGGLDDENEKENLIQTLSTGIYQVLGQNQELLRFLFPLGKGTGSG